MAFHQLHLLFLRVRRNLVMDKVWSINVKVPQGYQWWHVAYDAEADA
jgi:hypothetical protein